MHQIQSHTGSALAQPNLQSQSTSSTDAENSKKRKFESSQETFSQAQKVATAAISSDFPPHQRSLGSAAEALASIAVKPSNN